MYLYFLIYPQLENTSTQLEELIDLFNKNKDLTPPVSDLPINAIGVASYDELKTEVTTVKNKMTGFKTGTPPANDLAYISEIYKIVVYLERLDLKLDDVDANTKSTQPNNTDTYKNKLLNLRDKKRTLLLRLYNEPGAGYVKGTHEPIDDTDPNIILITNAALGNGGVAPLLNLATTSVASPPNPATAGNLNLVPNDRYTYLIGVSKSLTGFTSAIVELNYELSLNIDNVKGIQPPPPPTPTITTGAGGAGAGTGAGGAGGGGAGGDTDTEPETDPDDLTEGDIATLVVVGASATALAIGTGALDGIFSETD